jgi:hypothetical protein
MNLFMLASVLADDLDSIRVYGCDSCNLCGLNGNQHTHDCPVPFLVMTRARMLPVAKEGRDE